MKLVFFSFELKVSLVIYELRLFYDPWVKTLLFKNENLHLFLHSRKKIFSENIIYCTVPGLDISPLCLSCYTVSIMPGEWTLSPVVMIKDQIKPMWNQTKCWDNAIGSIDKCNSFWCYWCSADRGMNTYLEQLQILENLCTHTSKLQKIICTAEDKQSEEAQVEGG